MLDAGMGFQHFGGPDKSYKPSVRAAVGKRPRPKSDGCSGSPR